MSNTCSVSTLSCELSHSYKVMAEDVLASLVIELEFLDFLILKPEFENEVLSPIISSYFSLMSKSSNKF